MTAKNIIPPGFQSAPVLLAVSDLLAERDMLLEAIERIADTDSRNGLEMQEVASDVIGKLLDHRVDVKLRDTK